eukprot:NODE_20135_length_811_cov_6.232456.p1 GENE.NODE_20135_length_811_cov_6.232456~~NODE_20135_length_811_cov_6.232456.p1  ORF type:complete len:162 (+),score=23.98 NODE_20135_length_811_cov_6.232456:179-664(+)
MTEPVVPTFVLSDSDDDTCGISAAEAPRRDVGGLRRPLLQVGGAGDANAGGGAAGLPLDGGRAGMAAQRCDVRSVDADAGGQLSNDVVAARPKAGNRRDVVSRRRAGATEKENFGRRANTSTSSSHSDDAAGCVATEDAVVDSLRARLEKRRRCDLSDIGT